MQLKRNKFLGSVSHQIGLDDCTITLVKYTLPVSEDWHVHPQLHLSMILGGGNLEIRKNEQIPVLPGIIMRYNKDETHRNIHTRFPSTNLNIEINDSFLEKYELTDRQFQSGFMKDPDLWFSLLKIFRELQVSDGSSSDSIQSILLSVLAESCNGESSSTPPWVKLLHQILSDRWNEFISLSELSRELNMHPVTISKKFPDFFGCTLADYMRKIKIERAAYQFMNSSMPFAEIAYHCGFSDQSHLTRVFKSYTGYTPHRYRNL